MRGRTALGVVALAGAIAAASEVLIRLNGPLYTTFVVYCWLMLAGVVLIGLLYLYLQIWIGPRATVSERTADKLERALKKARALHGPKRERRETRLVEQASTLAELIDPAGEARAVFKRRVRLANAVLALICVLSIAFWIFTECATQVWPQERWFIDAHGPDAYHAALFSVDQVLRGTLFDLFDVFDWNISNTHYDPNNKWFSAFIVIYRVLMSGALFAAIAARIGTHEDWHEKAAHGAAEEMKTRLARLAGRRPPLPKNAAA
jgi:hypothetical protein